MEIRLVPLRERREDIPYLAAVFIREVTDRLNRPLTGMTAAAERMLLQAPWPGNVRELRNVIERACLLSDGKMLSERDVLAAMPPGDRRAERPPVPTESARARGRLHAGSGLRDQRAARAGRTGAARGARQQGGRGASAGHQPSIDVSLAGAPGSLPADRSNRRLGDSRCRRRRRAHVARTPLARAIAWHADACHPRHAPGARRPATLPAAVVASVRSLSDVHLRAVSTLPRDGGLVAPPCSVSVARHNRVQQNPRRSQ